MRTLSVVPTSRSITVHASDSRPEVTVSLVTRNVILSTTGLRGLRGLSTYELAVQNGFTGTLEEFLSTTAGWASTVW